MASNIIEVVKGVLKDSPIKEVELAALLGIKPNNMNNKLSSRARNDMPAGQAARFLDFLGYQLVVVPKGKRLPEGSIVIEYVEK